VKQVLGQSAGINPSRFIVLVFRTTIPKVRHPAPETHSPRKPVPSSMFRLAIFASHAQTSYRDMPYRRVCKENPRSFLAIAIMARPNCGRPDNGRFGLVSKRD